MTPEQELKKEIENRVIRGAELLDQRKPAWYDRINLSALDIKTIGCCVLDQLYGDDLSGCLRLGLVDSPDVDTVVLRRVEGEHGFGEPDELGYDPHIPDLIKEEWGRQIVARKTKETSAEGCSW